MSMINRRQFMNQAATTAGLVSFGATRLAGVSANHKLNIAAIGVGGMGAGNIEKSSNENIVALCDVDFKRGAQTFNRHPKARRFKDFRVMFDKMEKEIDEPKKTPEEEEAEAKAEAEEEAKEAAEKKDETPEEEFIPPKPKTKVSIEFSRSGTM